MRGSLRKLGRDSNGAVAPTVALSLFAIIAAGGIAFDYARMATLDTELQDAADQAALAAASQLDGEDGACERSVAAARNMLANRTLMANETAGTRAITIADPGVCGGDTSITFNPNASIRFYQDIGKTTPSDDDSNAKFVEVEVDSRRAFFALTPVVAALSSGDLSGTAFAGLGEAVCNTPPVMMCNPSEPEGNTNAQYPFTASEGDGVRLIIGNPDAPGNFGFLQTGYGTGAQALARALGYNNPPADCAPTNGVDTEPGDKEAVRAAFNTRFDLSESGLTCPNGGTCSPSVNSRKDLVRGNNCGIAGQQGWQEAPNPYRPTDPTTPLDGTNDPDIMGYPRDMCHAVSRNGRCETDGVSNAGNQDRDNDGFPDGDIIGDAAWDRDAYFRVNYGWDSATWQSNLGLGPNVTRYQVYKWEMANPSVVAAAGANVQVMSNGKTGYSTPICRSPGITPDDDTPDRRRIPIAVINCEAQGLSGREYGVEVLDWYDVFLTAPAVSRGSPTQALTGNGDIYVEVIGKVTTTSNSTLQVVKKAVPYLIE